MSRTLLTILLLPVIAWALYLPGRIIARWLWRRMPDGRLKRALFKDRSGLVDYPPGVKRWDQ